ncbi:MAG: metal ABC transporter permease [Geobacteraceae bacterium]|nr:metal ABC transporter permease [Geobacteraceae bacterium]
MIADFFASWELFHHAYLVGWLLAFVLSVTGVIVVARNQIFIGAAVSQASTLGIALALWLGGMFAGHGLHWLASAPFLSGMAVIFSVMGALITAGGDKAGRESREAVTGWVFLFSASASILVVARSPHGVEEIHKIVASSIIGATFADFVLFLAAAVAAAGLAAVTHRRLLLLIMDPAMAAAVGMRTRLWGGAVSVWLGLVVGLSIRSSGMLYTFGCLVLPALVAKNLCREVRPMFLVSPLVGVGAGVAGFVLANHYDYPPGQLTVVLLCLALSAAWLRRRVRTS